MREQGSERVETTDHVIDITDGAVSMLGAPVHAQVLAHLRDAVMLVDAGGVVSYASPNSAAVLGRPPEHFIGSPLVERLGAPDVGAIERALAGSPLTDPGAGALLFGGATGPLTLFVDHPVRLGPPGTRLLTFRPASADDDTPAAGVLSDPLPAARTFDPEAAARLAAAIADDELTVHYQPEIDLETGLVLGAEALVRWMHPDRGEVSAGDFVELAERAGLIDEIGRVVLRQACADFGSWAKRFGGTVLTLRVNLSPEQLGDDGLVDVVAAALAAGDLDPHSLCVEVTETALMADPSALDVLDELRRTGIEVAVDDFGTGFSSLSQLKRLPVDVLKVDRSFVAGLGVNRDSTTIVSAIIDLAHALELVVIAEGVETPTQLAELRRLNCDQALGFLFSKPVPADELEMGATHPIIL